MAGALLPVLIGSTACAAGVAALRLAWAQPRRSAGLNALAWGAVAAGLVVLAWADGAWGVAVGLTAAMLTAAIFLAIAAAAPGNGRRRDEAAAIRKDRDGRPELALGRRTAIFLLVVPGAFAASVLLSLAALGLARQAGWSEADGIALAFYLFPFAWTATVLAVMFRSRLRSAFVDLTAVSAAAAVIAWIST